MTDVHNAQALELSRQILEAQEEERRRIARDLHDDFKQRLATLGLELTTLAAAPPDRDWKATGGLCERLVLLAERVETLGSDLGRIAQQLHPAALERFGLAEALVARAADLEALRGLKVYVTLHDATRTLPSDVALGVYRIAQEALENAARHAEARGAWLCLTTEPEALRLTVRDDGIGFDPESLRGRGGLGLASMGERARLLGGRLHLTSAPGAGTRIDLVIPLDDWVVEGPALPEAPREQRPSQTQAG